MFIHNNLKTKSYRSTSDVQIYMLYTSYVLLNPFQGSHFSGDSKFHVFSRLIPGKINEILSHFGFESSVCSDNVDMTKI